MPCCVLSNTLIVMYVRFRSLCYIYKEKKKKKSIYSTIKVIKPWTKNPYNYNANLFVFSIVIKYIYIFIVLEVNISYYM